MKCTMTSFIKWHYYSICDVFFEIFISTRSNEHLFLREAYLLTLIQSEAKIREKRYFSVQQIFYIVFQDEKPLVVL